MSGAPAAVAELHGAVLAGVVRHDEISRRNCGICE
jgi:hypothetical protein